MPANSPSEPQAAGSDTQLTLEFNFPKLPDATQVKTLMWKQLLNAGVRMIDNPKLGYAEPNWEDVKLKIQEIMVDKVVTTGTPQDLEDHSITEEELYVAVLGVDALGLSGESLSVDEKEAFTKLKGKLWGFLNLGTTGFVGKSRRGEGLVMIEGDVPRPKINPQSKVKFKGTETGRFLTASHTLITLQTKDIVTRELDKAFTKVNNFVKAMGEAQPDLAIALAKQGQQIAKTAAEKFVYGDPRAVAALQAGTNGHGELTGGKAE